MNKESGYPDDMECGQRFSDEKRHCFNVILTHSFGVKNPSQKQRRPAAENETC